MRLLAVLALCAGCHAVHRPDPIAAARLVARTAARALEAHDDRLLDAQVSVPEKGIPEARPEGDEPECKRAVAVLTAAGREGARVFARAHAHGPLGSGAVLERGPEGWRVDPRTVNAVLPTPAAAIEQLAGALDRLSTDPALALLSRTLRDSLLSAAAQRSRGLRDLIGHLAPSVNGRLPVQLEYGQGFFVVLRPEEGGWRVDDFN